MSFAAITVAWKFIHSESFSREISKRVSVLLTKKTGAELSFKRVEFGFFPPSTRFKEVSLNKPHQNRIGAILLLEELGVSFTYASLFSSNLEIDELELKNGNIAIDYDEDKNEKDIDWHHVDLNDLFLKYTKTYNVVPIHLNLIRFENIDTKFNNISFKANQIAIAPHKKEIRCKVEIRNFKIGDSNISLDAITAQTLFEKKSWHVDHAELVDRTNSISFKGELLSPNKELEASGNGQFKFLLSSLPIYIREIPADLKNMGGQTSGSFGFKGNIFDPNIEMKAQINQFTSEWINLNFISATIQKKHNVISVQNAEAKNNQENYKILKPADVYDLNQNKFYNIKTQVEVAEAETNTFLYSIIHTNNFVW